MKVLILDIDGCLNLEYPSRVLNKNQHLLKKDPYGEAIWNLFEASTKNINAKPQFLPYYYFKSFKKRFDKIYIITARLERWRPQTEKWLNKWGFNYDHLYMRPNDKMSLESFVVKEKILKENILNKVSPKNCYACDDDLLICSMYRRNNINTYQTPVDWPLLIEELKVKQPKLPNTHKELLKYYLIKEYTKGKLLKEIAVELGYRNYRSLISIKGLLKADRILNTQVKKRYKRVDISDFKHLTSETAAYVLGFAASNGVVDISSGGGTVEWNQPYKDEGILLNIKKSLGAEQKVVRRGDMSYFAISQLSLVNLLVYRWGITPKKSLTLKFPQKIPKENLHHFLRGVYDGDGYGCFYLKEGKGGAQFTVRSVSIEFIEGISKVYKKLKIKHTVSKHYTDTRTPNPIYSLRVSNLAVKKFYDFLYKDAKLFIKRKKDIIEGYINKPSKYIDHKLSPKITEYRKDKKNSKKLIKKFKANR